MRKVLFAVLMLALLLTACKVSEDNIKITAIIESVHENSIMVTVKQPTDFEKASVGIDSKTKIVSQDGEKLSLTDLSQGDVVEMTLLPEIRESYPVQVDAVKIVLVESGNEMISQKASYQKISPKKAKEMMEDESVIILDVRTKEEYQDKRIPDSILLPYDEIKERATESLSDKDATILVYCRSGNRSAIAAKELIAMGYTNIYDFGGILSWDYETTSGN